LFICQGTRPGDSEETFSFLPLGHAPVIRHIKVKTFFALFFGVTFLFFAWKIL